MKEELIEKINGLLPQTQCEECGFKGCLPYAAAIAEKKETIDKCAPGGIETLQALAVLLGEDPKPFEKIVKERYRAPSIAFIEEESCIGCVKCIKACPVDAIVGASKEIHTIISDMCTGCELCVPLCPTDCIVMLPIENIFSEEAKKNRALVAKEHYEKRNERLDKISKQKEEQDKVSMYAKKALIEAALKRAKGKNVS
jgi:electron transport complex protein RnfB